MSILACRCLLLTRIVPFSGPQSTLGTRHWRTSIFTDGPISRQAPCTEVQRRLLVTNFVGGEPPSVNLEERKVVIGWDALTCSRFHNIWLRDHCRCPECFHAVTKQRLLNTFDIPSDISPVSAKAKVEGLEVAWSSSASDPHVSLYPWTWLERNSYDPPSRSVDTDEDGKILWNSTIERSPPTITYEEAMNKDHGLFKWLSNINKFGFCFVSGVPPSPEATEALSRRIGFIRETQYGTFWDFTSDLGKGDTAYTTLALGAHTDNTYFTDPCGLQVFHLLSHTEGTGGTTLLVDGFNAVSILKQHHPDAYTFLSQTPIPAHAAGESTEFYRPSPVFGYPVLKHDPVSGALVQVRWNNDDRSVMNHLEPNNVEKWYESIRAWNQCLTDKGSEYWVQLKPGTVVVIDNHRVLHGRSAFTGKRRMCGAYIGVDEYKSKLAVLRETFSPNTAHLNLNDTCNSTENYRSVWSDGL